MNAPSAKTCLAADCENSRVGPSGYCAEHFGQGGRARAREAEDALLSDPDRDWCTLTETAERCGLRVQAIRERIRRGALPAAEKDGRTWRIPVTAVGELRTEIRENRRRRPLRTMPEPDETEARRSDVRRLHAQGMAVTAMVAQLEFDRRTIERDHKALCLEPHLTRRSPGTLTPKQTAELPALYAHMTLAEIAANWGVSPGGVLNALKKLGISSRPSGTRPIYPVPEERRCDNCETMFTPVRSRGDRRFCSTECANVGAHDAFAKALADHQAAVGHTQLSSTDAAAYLHVGLGTIHVYVAKGLLTPAERIEVAGYGGRCMFAFSPAEVHRFQGWWARGEGSKDGRRLRWTDPDKTAAHHQAMGWLHQETDELILRARVEERQKRLANRRRGRHTQPPPEYHWHWLKRYLHHEMDLIAAYELDRAEAVAAGEKPPKRPSRLDVCAAVALEDWPDHPERWSRDRYPPDRPPNDDSMRPGDLPSAAKTVWAAVKPLLSTVTGNGDA